MLCFKAIQARQILGYSMLLGELSKKNHQPVWALVKRFSTLYGCSEKSALHCCCIDFGGISLDVSRQQCSADRMADVQAQSLAACRVTTVCVFTARASI